VPPAPSTTEPDPTAAPPPPAETTETPLPAGPEDPVGSASGDESGDTKPGNGYGDDKHDHDHDGDQGHGKH
jgi:hypothetical protein